MSAIEKAALASGNVKSPPITQLQLNWNLQEITEAVRPLQRLRCLPIAVARRANVPDFSLAAGRRGIARVPKPT